MPAVTLSILIPTIESRKPLLNRLVKKLENQAKKNNLSIEILTLPDKGKLEQQYMSIGAKCNKLMVAMAKGEYIVFIGDDDTVSSDYLAKIFEAINSGKTKPACITFNVKMTTGGAKPMKQVYALENKHYQNKSDVELRPPGMITPIKRSLVSKYPFQEFEREKDRGTDYHWAMKLVSDQVLKTSVHIDKFLYQYRYNLKK